MVIEPTGERFIPEVMGGQLIEAEHVVRYALAAQLVKNRRVLDAGCGVGWGSALLSAAGASSVSGLDLDDDAVADARRRVPSGEFVQGNLARLPWEDGHFELVVCFEALEHVTEQEATLDELVRVLAPSGLLLVSSPNPRVYPSGNPFHVHELTPEELVEAVGKRLPNIGLWNQYTQVASVLVQEGAFSADETKEVLARVVAPLLAGSDPYSMVVAGHGPLPSLPPLVGLAPSDELLHLEAHSALLSEEHQRIMEERERILAERSELLRKIDEQQGTIGALDEQRETLRREREHTSALLLEGEQQLAAVLATEPMRRSAALEDKVARLEQEIAALRASTSWHVTAPLRAATRLLSTRR